MKLDLSAIEPPTSPAGGSPWARGQLPSPWATSPSEVAGGPNLQSIGGAAPESAASSPLRTFSDILERAHRTAAGSDDGNVIPKSLGIGDMASSTRHPGSGIDAGLNGFSVHSLEMLGKRLSKSDAEVARSVQNLQNLDPTSPNLSAEMLSVSLLSAKAGVSYTLSTKFASKINESINTLLKTN